jgi:uncharacterized repeat protein (TIGR03803 family)
MMPPVRNKKEKDKWNLAVLYKFEGSPDGSAPVGIVWSNAGKLYGATGAGGNSGKGTVFSLAP